MSFSLPFLYDLRWSFPSEIVFTEEDDLFAFDDDLFVCGGEVDGGLSSEQEGELHQLLDEFADVFSTGANHIGLLDPSFGIYHHIDTGDARPRSQKPYKCSMHELAFLQAQVEMMLKHTPPIIRPSSSPWLSPCILVKRPKEPENLRLCIDYRHVNSCTVRDAFPLPLIDEVLAAMSGATYFSNLDLVSGFWQIHIHPDDIPKTAFTTPFGNFEFLRMPFGLVNAPSTFQRVMARIMHGLPFVKVYLDDVFIFSKTWAEHLQHLRVVLERIRASGLLLKRTKCRFATSSVECLGYVVDRDGLRTHPNKVAAIAALRAPSSAAEVRSFLGMLGFYERFIPSYARIAAPLRLLTRKNVAFEWSPECAAAFEQLKAALCTAPVLRLPVWSRPFILTTDWSVQGIGAVLAQTDPKTDQEHPIAFASRALTAAEKNYAPTEGECLALLWAVTKFRLYLHGHPFTAVTDHHALQWLQKARFTNAKLERWALRLQEFSYTVKYRRGVDNVVADCLSRLTPLDSVDVAAVWPGQASRQADVDDIPCTICHDAGGWDNMCICEGCERTFHLRCLIPPQTTPPSGPWYCPACDPFYSNRLEELRWEDTVLAYSKGDPHLDLDLLAFLEGGDSSALPQDKHRRKAILDAAAGIRLHPGLPGWLLVYKKIRGRERRWLVNPPVEYRWDVIRMVHESLGHAGISQTLAALHLYYHWRNVKEDIARYIKSCDACQRQNLALPSPPDLQEPEIYGPLQHLHVDLAGPFPAPTSPSAPLSAPPPDRMASRKDKPKVYIVLMVDYFTKVAELEAVPNKDATTVARTVYNCWITRYGTPRYLTSDNGTEFRAEFSHMLSRLAISHIHTSVAHPAANGAVERLVRTVKEMLNKTVNDHAATWTTLLPSIRMAYMNKVHSALGVSPNEMLMGHRPPLPLPASLPATAVDTTSHSTSSMQYVDGLEDYFAFRHADARERLHNQFHTSRRRQQDARQEARHQRTHTDLHAGDLVLELIDEPGALRAQARGPYRIIGFKRDGAIAILQTGSTDFRDAQTFERHITRLAKYFDKWSV